MHPNLFLAIFAGLIVLAFMIICWVMFGGKQDPDEEKKNRGKTIRYMDEKGQAHYDEPKMKVK
jgi:hypothetical protein